MKKILIIISGALLIVLMAFNLSLNQNQHGEKNINIEDINALASCLEIEQNGNYLGQCCPPWTSVCGYIYDYWTVRGELH